MNEFLLGGWLMFKQTGMRKSFVILTIILLLFLSPSLYATRIVIFGDSWGEPMKPALQAVFANNGHADIFVETTEFWGLAARLSSPEGLSFITEELSLRPELDIVHLSIGVNDVHCTLVGSTCRTNWNPDMAGSQSEMDILTTVVTDVEIIVDHILSIRPEVQIFWAGDDWVRPRDPVTKYGTPPEHNAVHIKQAELAEQLANRKPGLSYLHLHGLLQVTFGFDGIQHTQWDPSVLIPAGDPSLPNQNLPGPDFAFETPAHPNPVGYGVLAGGYYEGFYGPFLNNEFKINPGLNDAWYNPDTDGQGFFITVFPDLNAASLAWFTYDTELLDVDAAANLGDAGHRWLTAVGPIEENQVVMDIEMTSGGLFDSATTVERTDPPGSDGTITLRFHGCNSGTIEYDIPSINKQGVVPIKRVADDNIVICEALDAE